MDKVLTWIVCTILLLPTAYFVLLLYACISGQLDPKCVHLMSPPPAHFYVENGRTTCD